MSQQSQQLNEIKGAIIVLQKNMDEVNEQNKTLKPSNKDDDQLINQM